MTRWHSLCCVRPGLRSFSLKRRYIGTLGFANAMGSGSPSLESTIATLRRLIRKGVPSFQGTIPFEASSSLLFFKDKNENTRIIDFLDHTEADLKTLSDACDVATFGLNDQDVYDETYRKAVKLDTNKFAAQFASVSADILEGIKDRLVPEDEFGDRPSLRAELYKLNVYGPGSFFKPHVDTPRSESMIASLVVVLPTIHEGGALALRHNGEEEVFNTSRASFGAEVPREMHWTAFYSDIEHEVLPVQSGYRITLTYNIYTIPKQPIANLSSNGDLAAANPKYISTLQGLFCKNEGFLPGGGLVGFGLSHKYAFKTMDMDNMEGIPPVSSVASRLKGRDHELFTLLTRMGLKPSLKIAYFPSEDYDDDDDETHNMPPLGFSGGYTAVLCDKFINPPCMLENESLTSYLMEFQSTHGSTKTHVYEDEAPLQVIGDKVTRFPGIYCVTPFQQFNQFCITFATYGNYAETSYCYGNAAPVVDLPQFDRRQAMGAAAS